MSQEPCGCHGWPCVGRLRRVHAFTRRDLHRPHLSQMRCMWLSPQLPPPRSRRSAASANPNGYPSHRVPTPPPPPPSPAAWAQPKSTISTTDLFLVLPILSTPHAPRPLGRLTRPATTGISASAGEFPVDGVVRDANC